MWSRSGNASLNSASLRQGVLLRSPQCEALRFGAAKISAFRSRRLGELSVSVPQGAEVDVCAEVGEARGVQRVHKAVLGDAPASTAREAVT